MFQAGGGARAGSWGHEGFFIVLFVIAEQGSLA